MTHRRRRYGPFDYEWSKDFAGIELTFAGDKFGEYCGKEEIFADLKTYGLPAAVVPVATIVMGCVVYGVLNGLQETRTRPARARPSLPAGTRAFRPDRDRTGASAAKRNLRRRD